MAASEQDRQQIAAVIEQYRCGFATVDVEDLKAVWDQDYDNIIYIAQELAQPVQGWAGVEQYYKRVAKSLERVRTMTVSDLSVDVFGEVAYADQNDEAAHDLMEEILDRPLFAHLATASEHGPRESPVWFLWEDGAFWIIGNYKTDSFPKRIEQEPCCAIGVVHFEVATGLVQHVGFRGRGHLEPQDQVRVKRLLRRYMGEQEQWDPRFVAVLGDMDYVLVRFEPETVVVRDQSYILNKDAAKALSNE